MPKMIVGENKTFANIHYRRFVTITNWYRKLRGEAIVQTKKAVRADNVQTRLVLNRVTMRIMRQRF